MKHVGSDSQLVQVLADAGVELPEAAASRCVQYLEAVLQKTKVVNLTAVSEFEAALRLHLVDSLLVLDEITSAPAGAMLDLGSGGGFPGTPLAIASGRPTCLLDSVRKKTEAVAECLRVTGIPESLVWVMWGRAEEVAQTQPNSFAVITARAVAELPILVELASPLLQQGGRLVAMKGALTDDEAQRGAAAASLAGMEIVATRRYSLPGAGEQRTVVIISRKGRSRVALPRRPGMANKSPLA